MSLPFCAPHLMRSLGRLSRPSTLGSASSAEHGGGEENKDPVMCVNFDWAWPLQIHPKEPCPLCKLRPPCPSIFCFAKTGMARHDAKKRNQERIGPC